MDKQDYLNQISASSRPLAAKKTGFWNSIYFKLGIGAAVALIAIMILGAIISSGQGGEKNDSISLRLKLDGTMEMISTYQTDVKSSELRSSSASLYGVLSNVRNDVNQFLETKYNFKERDIDKKVTAEAEEEKLELNNELFKAKINGILDRIYAHKMAYEITIIATREQSLMKVTNDETLRSQLETSYNSLNNLYTKFSDFSETK